MKNYGGDRMLLHFKAPNIYLHVKNQKNIVSPPLLSDCLFQPVGTLVDSAYIQQNSSHVRVYGERLDGNSGAGHPDYCFFACMPATVINRLYREMLKCPMGCFRRSSRDFHRGKTHHGYTVRVYLTSLRTE